MYHSEIFKTSFPLMKYEFLKSTVWCAKNSGFYKQNWGAGLFWNGMYSTRICFFKLENHEKIVAVVQKISMENYQIRIKFEKKKLPAHLYVWPDEFWVDSRI